MKKIRKKPELLAPAGNLEKAKTAFAFGADAVYLGIPDFSLRVRINDFTITKIKQATEYAHKLGKKVYATVNIFVHNQHLKKLPEHIEKLKKIGVDGIFISDPAVLQTIKKVWPQAKIILSTQANCTNWQAAKYWYDQGVSCIILSRELSVKEIAKIHQKVPKLELECFVHGAMCMAYSGRCFLSKFFTQHQNKIFGAGFTDRNANLGDCIQPCRWNYNVQILEVDRANEPLELVEEIHGSYILNSQDLCLIKKLDKLIKAGITGFKIEGRAKSVYYVAIVVGVYRKAIDLVTCNLKPVTIKKELNYLYKELEEKLFHRGYTVGFMFGQGKMAQAINQSHKKCKWEFCGQIIQSKKSKVRSKKYANYIKVHNSIKVGDSVEIIMPIYDIIKIKVNKLYDAQTGEQIKEAHGGQGRVVVIQSNVKIPQYSVIRRKVK